MSETDNNVLESSWAQLLEQSKHQLPEHLWKTLISENLLPMSHDNHQLVLYSMAPFKIPLLRANPTIINTIQSLGRTIFQDDLLVVQLTDKFNEDLPSDSTPTSMVVNETTSSTKEISTFGDIPNNVTVTYESDNVTYDDVSHPDLYPADATIPTIDDEYDYDPPVGPTVQPSSQGGTLFTDSDFELITEPMPVITSHQEKRNDLTLKTSNLKEDYTFQNFIYGEPNSYAYHIAKQIATSEDTQYNPFYIYGKSGVGKTHLMHAIGHEMLRLRPHAKVIAITSENFLNAFVESIQTKKNSAFRETFRNVDLLLIDDIQFLEEDRYASTQKEFFHTFNHLLDKGKKIVLTSDMGPDELKMENRIITRFKGGIYQEIALPDSETIMAIIRSEIDRHRVTYPTLQVSQDTILFFGKNFDRINVRDIKGAFKKVVLHAEIKECLSNVGLEVAKEALSGVIRDSNADNLSINLIIDVVSDYYKIKRDLIIGQKRTKHIAIARQIAMYLCRDLINESYPQISLAFGKKDHTTSLHAYDKISSEMEKQGDIKRTVEEIKSIILHRV